MRTESLDAAYLVLPDGAGPHPGVVVVHEAFGLNDNIRDICRRLAAEGYAALGVDLFEGRNRAVCMARMFLGGMAGNLEYYGVPALKAALRRLAGHPGVDAARLGAVGLAFTIYRITAGQAEARPAGATCRRGRQSWLTHAGRGAYTREAARRMPRRSPA